MSDLSNLKNECNKALKCLYIAVDEQIAQDVNIKVKRYIEALEQEVISNKMEDTKKLSKEELNELNNSIKGISKP